jgi:hypothetical protein
VVGALAAERFGKTAWPTPITGVRNGSLSGLPAHTIQEGGEGGREVTVSVEALVSIEAQEEAARAGLAVLLGAVDRDTVVLGSAPMAHRGPKAASGGDPKPTTTLADAFFVARVARVLEQLAAAIPEGTPPKATAEVVQLALAEVFSSGDERPEVRVESDEHTIRLTVRPRGFGGAELDELTLGARLG